ncbi:MAG TPA: hypothetical protein VF452_11080 [Candidatus Binatia bacterium]
MLELGLVVESLPVPEALTGPEPLVVPVRDDGAVDDLVELVSDEHPQKANPKLQEMIAAFKKYLLSLIVTPFVFSTVALTPYGATGMPLTATAYAYQMAAIECCDPL